MNSYVLGEQGKGTHLEQHQSLPILTGVRCGSRTSSRKTPRLVPPTSQSPLSPSAGRSAAQPWRSMAANLRLFLSARSALSAPSQAHPVPGLGLILSARSVIQPACPNVGASAKDLGCTISSLSDYSLAAPRQAQSTKCPFLRCFCAAFKAPRQYRRPRAGVLWMPLPPVMAV